MSFLTLLTKRKVICSLFFTACFTFFLTTKVDAATIENNIEAMNRLSIERPLTVGKINSNFGYRTVNGISRLHAGVDVATKIGTPIYAISDGVIKDFHNDCPTNGFFDGQGGGCFKNNKQMGWGNNIHLLFENNYFVIYAHLLKTVDDLEVGMKVKKGELIGWTGNSGNSTGPHLHFELRTPNGTAIDSSFLFEASTRLLDTTAEDTIYDKNETRTIKENRLKQKQLEEKKREVERLEHERIKREEEVRRETERIQLEKHKKLIEEDWQNAVYFVYMKENNQLTTVQN